MTVTIRQATPEDFDAIWDIFHAVVAQADTYSYYADTPPEYLRNKWLGEGVEAFVACVDGKVAGIFLLQENRPGYGDHVANGSFMVSPDFRGKGIGRIMGEYALARAKERGFLAIQYNYVVSSNEAAVNLWKSLGFSIIGTVPQGFRHKELGLVDVYIMHRFL
jgi:ribosomal protein S18 acetylase RimI-like enzyme